MHLQWPGASSWHQDTSTAAYSSDRPPPILVGNLDANLDSGSPKACPDLVSHSREHLGKEGVVINLPFGPETHSSCTDVGSMAAAKASSDVTGMPKGHCLDGETGLQRDTWGEHTQMRMPQVIVIRHTICCDD